MSESLLVAACIFATAAAHFAKLAFVQKYRADLLEKRLKSEQGQAP